MNLENNEGQPLELILARNLVSIISLAAVLVDAEGRIFFYNDAAVQLVGEPRWARRSRVARARCTFSSRTCTWITSRA